MGKKINQKIIKQQKKGKKSCKKDVQNTEISMLDSGHWKKSEQQKYIKFLRKYYYIMSSELLRYHYRIFTKMSKEIDTRTPVQCKSHHQKMLTRANYLLENLVFRRSEMQGPVIVGEGQEDGNHLQVVKQGMKNMETCMEEPWVVVQTVDAVVVMIDDRFVRGY